jgi:hypothetical protein
VKLNRRVAVATRVAKVLVAGFALAIVTMFVTAMVAIGLGWQKSLATFVTSPWINVFIVVATLMWSWIVRKKLS